MYINTVSSIACLTVASLFSAVGQNVTDGNRIGPERIEKFLLNKNVEILNLTTKTVLCLLVLLKINFLQSV